MQTWINRNVNTYTTNGVVLVISHLRKIGNKQLPCQCWCCVSIKTMSQSLWCHVSACLRVYTYLKRKLKCVKVNSRHVKAISVYLAFCILKKQMGKFADALIVLHMSVETAV